MLCKSREIYWVRGLCSVLFVEVMRDSLHERVMLCAMQIKTIFGKLHFLTSSGYG